MNAAGNCAPTFVDEGVKKPDRLDPLLIVAIILASILIFMLVWKVGRKLTKPRKRKGDEGPHDDPEAEDETGDEYCALCGGSEKDGETGGGGDDDGEEGGGVCPCLKWGTNEDEPLASQRPQEMRKGAASSKFGRSYAGPTRGRDEAERPEANTARKEAQTNIYVQNPATPEIYLSNQYKSPRPKSISKPRGGAAGRGAWPPQQAAPPFPQGPGPAMQMQQPPGMQAWDPWDPRFNRFSQEGQAYAWS